MHQSGMNFKSDKRFSACLLSTLGDTEHDAYPGALRPMPYAFPPIGGSLVLLRIQGVLPL